LPIPNFLTKKFRDTLTPIAKPIPFGRVQILGGRILAGGIAGIDRGWRHSLFDETEQAKSFFNREQVFSLFETKNCTC
jgi:hypothetical protein